MQVDGKPPAVSTTNAAASGGGFSTVVERILSTAERRESSLLTPGELQALSELSAAQSSMQQGGKLADDLGFADVDPDLIGQLVGTLEKQVVAASAINIIQLSYNAAKAIQTKQSPGNNSKLTMDQWIQYQGKQSINALKLGLEAAAILLFIITSPGMDRSVVNEDAIEASIVLFRNNLSKNILPATNQVGHIVAGGKPTTTTTPTPSKKRRRSSVDVGTGLSGKELAIAKYMKKLYPSILTTVGPTVLVMERLDTLVQNIPLDDQELLLIASGALASLELDPSVAVLQLVHQMHVAATGLVTSIFRLYARLRQLIMEDLFPLMPKLPTSKRSMRTFSIRGSSVLYPSGLLTLAQSMVPANPEPQYIQTISVLIMSLVQSAVLRPTHTNGEDDDESSGQLQSGLRHCQAISDLFVQHLLQRCAKKGEDGGASEFRPLLSNLMDDLLLVVLVPEYPVAEMILLSIANRISRDLMQATRSSSKVSTSDTTYLNTIFDAFGRICAAEARILKFARNRPVHRNHPIRTPHEQHVQCYCTQTAFSNKLMLNCDRCYTWYHGDCVGLKRESVPVEWYCDACQLQRIVELERDRNTNLGAMGCAVALIDETYCMQRLLIDYLSIVSRQTGERGIQDAYGFQLARWMVELNASPTAAESNDAPQINANAPSMSALIVRLTELWDPSESSDLNNTNMMGKKSLSGMLHCLSDEGRSRMVVHLISKQSVLLMSFRRQIDMIVKFMANDTSALLRKLSLKAIERVTDSDQQLMIYSFMKKAVTQRFSDESISVREAAVSLVGAYVVRSPAVANSFHAAFMIGLKDSGVSVRKRTIKILEDILCSNPNYKGRAEACSEMLRLAADPKEDDGVRDLIHAVFMKVWLDKGGQSVPQLSSVSPSPTEPKTPTSGYVQGLEERPLTTGGKTAASAATAATPASPVVGQILSPPMTRETRSSERRTNKRRLQIRSEIAAEQMVEVVKAANTGEHLTTLFRELLYAAHDAGTSRKSSQRKKQKLIAQDHCSMLVDALLEILLSFEENRSEITAPGNELVAIMRTIKVFTDVSVDSVVKHLDTLLPYMKADNGLSIQEEAVIVSSLSDIISQLAGVFDQQDVERLGTSSLADDLVNVTYKLGRNALSSAAQALCVLAHHRHSNADIPFRKKLLKLANVFYRVLCKHQDAADFSTQGVTVKANVHRSISVLGSICQYHETALKDVDMDEDDDESSMKPITWENLTFQCRGIFMKYLAKNDNQTKCVALRAMCGVFIAHPRELLRMNQSGMISKVMAPESPPSLQLEALLCWREILLAEEARIESGEAKAKMDSKKNITLSKRISGDQDGDATLFGAVLTSHAPRLLEMTQMQDKTIRFAALDLIGHLLRQGQVNPNETVPFLLALQGDVEEDGIRSLALKLLMIEGEKRPDMLRQRVCAGVKQAYSFQKSVYPDMEEVSALVKVKKHGSTHTECVFGRVFKECIRSIKKQRQGLFRNLLSLFDLQSRKDSFEAATPTKVRRQSTTSKNNNTFMEDLPMLSFTSQVLAYLPYSVASDPLYIIHNISSSLALRGPDLLDRLATFFRPYGLSSSDEMDETNVEEDALEIAAKRNRPHHAKEVTRLLESDFDAAQFSELCAEAGALTLLLRLKVFLRKAYNLSEARCIAYNPDEKERIAERAISKVAAMRFDSNLPMTVQSGSDLDCMIFQYSEFRQLMRAETSMELKLDEEDSEGEDEDNANKRKRSGSSDDNQE